MKIFYAIQATGNGHISRAITLLPHLEKWGKVDCFLSGNNSHLAANLPVRYRSKGISLYYNNTGGLDYSKIAFQRNPVNLYKEVASLPVENYDMVINDYECLTSLACRLKKVPSIHFGHQASFQYAETPRPAFKSWHGELILKRYIQASDHIGLHFENYHPSVFGAIIKKEMLDAEPTNQGHVTVYLPALHDRFLASILRIIPQQQFEVFSKNTKEVTKEKNILFKPIDQQSFNKSLITCNGVICGAGFETPAEAMHLGKKILAMPIWGQYEQYCNAAALNQMGVTTIDPYKQITTSMIENWLESGNVVYNDYSRSVEKSLGHLQKVWSDSNKDNLIDTRKIALQ
jgi:uncharacterized protein (TIGR00661 family)